MIVTRNANLRTVGLSLAIFLLGVLGCLGTAMAQAYINSSHGDSVNGVNRSTMTAFATGNCAHCHEQHASVGGIEPAPNTGTAAGPDIYLGFDVEQDLCYRCHGNGGEGGDTTFNIQTEFNKAYRHGRNGAAGTDYMETYDGDRHRANENTIAAFSDGSGALPPDNRHAECMDCHNPHTATAIDNADNTVGPLIGATGIDPTNASAGLVPLSYTFMTITNANHEYKICFKCHSDWAGTGTGTNQAEEFNPANEGKHCVESDKTCTPGIYSGATFNLAANRAYAMMPRYNGANDATLRGAMMRCSDCHGPNGAGAATTPRGPHGSTVAGLLKVPTGSPYVDWDNTVMYQTDAGTIWCFNCHSPNFTGTGLSAPGEGNLHTNKHDDWACQYCHFTVPHGNTENGTANQRQHLLKPSVFTECVDSETSGNYNQHSNGCGNWVIPGCT